MDTEDVGDTINVDAYDDVDVDVDVDVDGRSHMFSSGHDGGDGRHRVGGGTASEARTQRGGSLVGSTVTLANCAIGAGVLATPYAVSTFGTIGGGMAIASAAGVVAYTLRALVRAGSAFGSTSYQGLVRDAFGAKVSIGVSVVLVVYLFGSCIAYLIIIGDSYEKVVGAISNNATATAWWANRRFAIAIAAAFLVTPLSLLREMNRLAPASVVALVSLAYTAGAIVCDAVVAPDTGSSSAARPSAFKLSVDSISAVPIIVFAFQCHIQVLAIFAELAASDDEPPSVSIETPNFGDDIEPIDSSGTETRRLKRMYTVISFAVGMCFIGYTLVAEAAYMSHPNVTSNVLDSYAETDAAMTVATALMGCSAVASFPVNHHAARAALDDLLASTFGWDQCAPGQAPLFRHVTQTIGFVVSTTLVAFVVKDLGEVFELVGATCGSLVMFVVPALLLLHPRMRRGKRRVGTESSAVLDADLRDLDEYTRELLSSVRGLLGEEERIQARDDDADGEFDNDGRDITRDDDHGENIRIGSGNVVISGGLMIIAAFVAVSNVYVLFFRAPAGAST